MLGSIGQRGLFAGQGGAGGYYQQLAFPARVGQSRGQGARPLDGPGNVGLVQFGGHIGQGRRILDGAKGYRGFVYLFWVTVPASSAASSSFDFPVPVGR